VDGTAIREVVPVRTVRPALRTESGAGTAFPATSGVASAGTTQHRPVAERRAKRTRGNGDRVTGCDRDGKPRGGHSAGNRLRGWVRCSAGSARCSCFPRTRSRTQQPGARANGTRQWLRMSRSSDPESCGSISLGARASCPLLEWCSNAKNSEATSWVQRAGKMPALPGKGFNPIAYEMCSGVEKARKTNPAAHLTHPPERSFHPSMFGSARLPGLEGLGGPPE
jgi:hypothetical protein